MSAPILHISFTELCDLESIESDVIISMVEHGIVKPIEGEHETEWVFESTTVHWIKKAARLAADFEIDWVAVALIIELIQQREALERENELYRLQLERFIEG
ncbi:chaperone modulator CbpM [Oceanicoccus sp. KOV_DT_Chl]|uniref:chaperone modulator CbpM n=1 Tax=Oceanicoccus sp. KOV_DT_Chl TaxID=1904639 RepID=UPI000C7BE940|nr:chaperone modulator CbpM [Oceanicoccus sp. KOV_DT_Chl]